jgi:phytanoyl-CoA hydroxylase
MTLTVAEIEQYEDEGYVVFPGLIRGAKLAYFKQILDELVARARAMETSQDGFNLQPDAEGQPIAGRLCKVQGACVIEPRLLELARADELVDRVADLIGDHLHIFGSKFFPMLAHGGTSTGWHQDNHYFGTDSEQVVSCGIYLEETDRHNGCLRLVPGSHRATDLVEHSRGQATYAHGTWAEVEESKVIHLECPAGTVALFSANLLHGAATNSSDRSRYSTAWHYIPAGLDLELFPFGEYEDRHPVRTRPVSRD